MNTSGVELLGRKKDKTTILLYTGRTTMIVASFKSLGQGHWFLIFPSRLLIWLVGINMVRCRFFVGIRV